MVLASASYQGTLDEGRRADLLVLAAAQDTIQEQTLWFVQNDTTVEWSHRDELSFATVFGSDIFTKSQIVFCPDISARDPPLTVRRVIEVSQRPLSSRSHYNSRHS